MSTTLPVRSSSGRALVEAPYTRRAGVMIGLAMLVVMTVANWGLGWAAVLSALVPIVVGASSAGVTEKARRWTNEMDNPLPMALGGGLLGAVTGGLLAPLWGLCAAVLGLGGTLALPAAAPGHLFFAGVALGSMIGAGTGLSVGMVRKIKDPLEGGLMAGGGAALLTGAGLGTGAFAGTAGVFGAWLGANPAIFSQMLTYAPSLLGLLGITLISGVAGFAGNLTVKGAEAREKRLALPDPSSFPSWARADSVTGFHRQNPTIYID